MHISAYILSKKQSLKPLRSINPSLIMTHGYRGIDLNKLIFAQLREFIT